MNFSTALNTLSRPNTTVEEQLAAVTVLADNLPAATPLLLAWCDHHLFPIEVCCDAIEDGALSRDFPMAALMLLGATRTGDAHRRIVEVLHADRNFVSFLLGDFLTEDGMSLLIQSFSGDARLLLGLLKAPGAGPYAKAAAGEALAVLACQGRLERDMVLQHLLAVAAAEGADDTVQAFAIDAMLDLGPVEHREQIAQIISAPDFDDSLRGLKATRERLDQHPPQQCYREDFQRWVERPLLQRFWWLQSLLREENGLNVQTARVLPLAAPAVQTPTKTARKKRRGGKKRR